jgi:WD40 repeat protein
MGLLSLLRFGQAAHRPQGARQLLAWLIIVAGSTYGPGGLTAGATPPDAREIQRLITQLGSAKFNEREAASERLEAIGGPAWYSLRKAAATSADPEIRRRAEALAQSIGKRLFVEVRSFGAGGGYWLNRVAFAPDGKRAIATGGAVIFYDLETGKELNRVLELQYARPGLALSRDGRYFLTGHQDDPVVRLGELQSGKPVQTFEGHTAGVLAVALSPDGSQAASGGNDRTLRLWDLKTGKELHAGKAAGVIRSLAYAPDGRFILSGHSGAGSDNLIHLWSAEDGHEVRSYRGHSSDVTAVAFLPDGRSLVSASMDGTVRLWDVKTSKELRRMEHRGGAYDVAVSPDGRRALSAGFGDRTVRLWDLTDGTELWRFEGHQSRVLGLAFSRDGRQALSSDANCTVRLWRLAD